MNLRLKDNEIYKGKGGSRFFRTMNDLDLALFDITAELKALKDKRCIIIHESIRELKYFEKPRWHMLF